MKVPTTRGTVEVSSLKPADDASGMEPMSTFLHRVRVFRGEGLHANNTHVLLPLVCHQLCATTAVVGVMFKNLTACVSLAFFPIVYHQRYGAISI